MRKLLTFLTLLTFVALLFLGGLLPGWTRRPELPKEVVEGLATTSSMTLYSLQPRGGPDIPEWDFHGHHVLGHLVLSNEQERIAIRALKDAVAAGEANVISGCIINPRHALRFKIEGNAYDILICYQCGQLELFKNNRRLAFGGKIGGKPDVLNGLLSAAQTTLADTDAALNESYAEEAKIALKRAQEGDASAENVIARMLMSGRGVAKDETDGIKWLSKSLGRSLDDPVFQVNLGDMYENGKDVSQNLLAAMNLYQKAAAQGSSDALLRIAHLYDCGEGINNQAKAVELYRRAAESGSAEAQFELGLRYARARVET